jgi:hypothetical protein
MLDHQFQLNFPSFRERILPYMNILRPAAVKRHDRAQSLKLSLDACLQMFSSPDISLRADDLQAIVHAAPALAYRCDGGLVHSFVHACINVAGKSDSETVLETLIFAMGSPVTQLRYETYRSLLLAIDCIENRGITLFDVSANQLLSHPKIFEQIISHGLHDNDLDSMPAEMLARLVSLYDIETIAANIWPVLPALQAMVGSEICGGLGQGLLNIVKPCQTNIQRFLSNCGFLFHQQESLRNRAAKSLALEFGLREHEVLQDPFRLPDGKISFPGSATYTLPRSQVCQESEASRVFEIFRSETLDLRLRRAAAEQLAILCQGKENCSYLYSNGLWAAVWNELEMNTSFNEICLALLIMFLDNSAHLREETLGDMTRLSTLVPFIFHSHTSIRAVTSRLLAVLVFGKCMASAESEDLSASTNTTSWPVPMLLPSNVCQNFLFCFPFVEAKSNQHHGVPPDEGISRWINEAYIEETESSTCVFIANALRSAARASCHKEAVVCLSSLQQVCAVNRAAAQLVWKNDWYDALARYLTVLPTALQDYDVLCSVLDLLACVLASSPACKEDIENLKQPLQNTINILRALSAEDEFSSTDGKTGWRADDIEPRSDSSVPSAQERVIDRFRVSFLKFGAALIECAADSATESDIASLLIFSDCFSIVCTKTFLGQGPRAYHIRNTALGFISSVLRHANKIDACLIPRLSVCIQFQLRIIMASVDLVGRFLDDHLVRTSLYALRRCMELRGGAGNEAGIVNPEFVDVLQKYLGACDSELRALALSVLRQIAWDPTCKHAWYRLTTRTDAHFCDRIVELALHSGESFAVRSEALRLISGMVRNGISTNGRSSQPEVDGQPQFDSHHEWLLHELSKELDVLAPPMFVGRVCELVLWHLVRLGHTAADKVDTNEVWQKMVSCLSIDAYWHSYCRWQKNAVFGFSISRVDWFHANASDIRVAGACVMQLMRALVIAGTRVCRADSTPQLHLDTMTESAIRLLVETSSAVGSKLSADRNDLQRAALDLWSMLMARTGDGAQNQIKQQLRISIAAIDVAVSRGGVAVFADMLIFGMQQQGSPALQSSSCRFVDVLLSAHGTDLSTIHASGTQCRAMASILADIHMNGNAVGGHPPAFRAAQSALGQLLVHSHDAKSSVLEDGLLPKLFERMLELHSVVRLSLLAGVDGRAPTPAERAAALSALHKELMLLKNLLHHSEAVKLAACDSTFVRVLAVLWGVALQDPDSDTTLHLVQVCANLCSHCEQATKWWDKQLIPSEHNVDATNVLYGAMKLAKRRHLRSDIGPSIFVMLRNFSSVKSARLHMMKDGFIDHCAKLLKHPDAVEAVRSLQRVADVIQIFTNIAFHTDGQLGLLKIKGLLAMLVDQLQSPNTDVQRGALFTLRNSAFARSNKPQFLAHKPAIPTLIDRLGSDDPLQRLYAASALHALAYDHQQLKGVLKRIFNSGAASGELGMSDADGGAVPPLLRSNLKECRSRIAVVDLPSPKADAGSLLPQAHADYSLLQLSRLLDAN